MIPGDPFAAIAELILGVYKTRKVQTWARLIFSLCFSATTSALFTCGSILVSTKSWPIALGSGMMIAAIVSTVLFRTSPLTKGMQAVLPSEEAAKEIESNLQVINK